MYFLSIINLIFFGIAMGAMVLGVYCLMLAIKALKIYISKNE